MILRKRNKHKKYYCVNITRKIAFLRYVRIVLVEECKLTLLNCKRISKGSLNSQELIINLYLKKKENEKELDHVMDKLKKVLSSKYFSLQISVP